MSRPLIGVTTSEVRLAEHADPLPEGDPPQREMALGMLYMRAIERAGGLPVVLPPLGHDAIAPLLDRLDGVCLSGGPDIDPRRLRRGGARPAARPDRADARRATSSRSPSAPTRAGLPVLGICRGAQALNVARGGTLHQHLPTHRRLDRAPPGRPRRTHDAPRADRARLAAGARDGRRPRPTVNSFHHQAVDRLGEGLRAGRLGPGRRRRGASRRRRRALPGRAVARRVARRPPRAPRAVRARWSRRPRPGAPRRELRAA